MYDFLPLFSRKVTSISRTAFLETNSSVSHMTYSKAWPVTVLCLGSRRLRVTNSTRSSSTSWQQSDLAVSDSLLAASTINGGTGWEWCAKSFLSAGWIDLITFSLKVVDYNIGTASFPTTPNFTGVCDWPTRRWRGMVPCTASRSLDAHQTCGMSCWSIVSSQKGFKTSA